jgi:hypothetical protein
MPEPDVEPLFDSRERFEFRRWLDEGYTHDPIGPDVNDDRDVGRMVASQFDPNRDHLPENREP